MENTYLPFPEVYEKLQPTLQELEYKRRFWRIKESLFRIMAIVGFVLTAIGLFYPIEEDESKPLWLAACVLLGIAMVIVGLMGRAARMVGYREMYHKKLAGLLVKTMDPSVISRPNAFVKRKTVLMTNLGLIGKRDAYSGKNLVIGKRGDTDFRFCEIIIADNTDLTLFSSFKGFFFEADFHKHFKAKTIVKPRNKAFSNLSRNNPLFEFGGERIHFENIEFEKEYDVYSTDPIEARYILSTRMISALHDLHGRFNCKIYASFFGDNMFLAINRKKDLFNRFFTRPATSEALIYEYYNDLTLFFDLVGALNLNTRIWSKRP